MSHILGVAANEPAWSAERSMLIFCHHVTNFLVWSSVAIKDYWREGSKSWYTRSDREQVRGHGLNYY